MNKFTVLVTGGSGGIGLELARCFARDGAAVVITGRDPAALAAAAADLEKEGAAVTALHAELGSPAGITRLLADLAAAGLVIDVLVNNAGFGAFGPLADSDPDLGAALTTVHVEAPQRLTRALLPGMLARRRGGVLNVGSLYSFSGAPYQALYGAAKAWVLAFTTAVREEVRGTGVTVTALCPGTTLSQFRTRHGHVDRASWLTLSSAEVAAAGHRGFRRNRAVVVPGFSSKLYAFATRLLPRGAMGRFVSFSAYRLRRMAAARTGDHAS